MTRQRTGDNSSSVPVMDWFADTNMRRWSSMGLIHYLNQWLLISSLDHRNKLKRYLNWSRQLFSCKYFIVKNSVLLRCQYLGETWKVQCILVKWDVKLFKLAVQGECNTRNKCRHYCVCWCPDNLCYRYISRPDIFPAIMFFMRLLWTRIYSVVAYDHTFVAISRVGYICMSLYVLNGLEMIISRPKERREVVLSISPNHCDNLPHYPHIYLSHKPIIIHGICVLDLYRTILNKSTPSPIMWSVRRESRVNWNIF